MKIKSIRNQFLTQFKRNLMILASVFLAGVIGVSVHMMMPHNDTTKANWRPVAGHRQAKSSHTNVPTASTITRAATGAATAAQAAAKPTTTKTAQLPAVASQTTATRPNGLSLYVDPTNDASSYGAAHGVAQISRLGQQPVAAWFGGWSNVTTDVNNYVSKAAAAKATPVLVAYNIPNRDCGGYSAGGAQTESDYATWIQQFANGIANRPAIVILEPDSVALQSCLNTDQLAARNRELSNASSVLMAQKGTAVYLDAGHSDWVSVGDIANRLKAAGVSQATGFALNVSNFGTTASNTDYGTQISAQLGGKHFIIDTSRNGNGPAPDNQWCNPAGRAVGTTPTLNTGNALVDAYLWVKTPWQSDGNCNGHPDAGQNDWAYALSLAQAAGW